MKGRFIRTKYNESPNAPWEYWECVSTERPTSELPNLVMRILSIAVNTATCERLFCELGLIHTAKRNRLAVNKMLDYHTVAKHVRQRSQKSSARSENPKKKLLMSPTEREIIFDVSNSVHTFTPSTRGAVILEDESDDEDPGDGVYSTMSLWGDFLDEVFQDEEIGAGYTAGETTNSTAGPQSTNLSVEELDNDVDDFELIPEATKHPFPDINDRSFPQEPKTLQGFRGLKATLAQLFG
ncbi:hypothetical protein DVH05_000682 [Phytophthora capsici]|nr:hypothetical protein DVH05_000682 [Phytophthora capsici]